MPGMLSARNLFQVIDKDPDFRRQEFPTEIDCVEAEAGHAPVFQDRLFWDNPGPDEPAWPRQVDYEVMTS